MKDLQIHMLSDYVRKVLIVISIWVPDAAFTDIKINHGQERYAMSYILAPMVIESMVYVKVKKDWKRVPQMTIANLAYIVDKTMNVKLSSERMKQGDITIMLAKIILGAIINPERLENVFHITQSRIIKRCSGALVLIIYVDQQFEVLDQINTTALKSYHQMGRFQLLAPNHTN